MAKPTSRATLIDYCLRNLGAPVIEINVDEDQLDDRVDDAIQYYQEYHGDAVVRSIRKHKITDSSLSLTSVVGINVGDTLTGVTSGAEAIVTEVTETGGGPQGDVRYTNVKVANTAFQSETVIHKESGSQVGVSSISKGDIENKYIDIPNTFLSVNNVFDIVTQGSSSNMFSVDYQLHLNDIFDLGGPYGGGLVNYEITKQYMSLINRNINGIFQKIEYTRHKNRVNFHSSETLDNLGLDKYIIFDGYEIVDPDTFTDVYNDMFLKNYLTALIKRQWGLNLIKFEGMQLPGGVTLNGRQIFDDAKEEIAKLEEEMQLKHEMPPHFIVG